MEYFELSTNGYHRMNIFYNLDNPKVQGGVDGNLLINNRNNPLGAKFNDSLAKK